MSLFQRDGKESSIKPSGCRQPTPAFQSSTHVQILKEARIPETALQQILERSRGKRDVEREA